MVGPIHTAPIQSEYADLLEDVMRLAAMHAAIHMMLVFENNGESLFDRRAIALLLYSLLGIAIYHLLIKRLVHVVRSDEKTKGGRTST